MLGALWRERHVKLGIIGCVLLFTWVPSAFSIQEVEIYTYDVLPPYAYRNDKQKLTGVYIEIVKTAISRMPGYSSKFIVVPWERAKFLAKTGSAFAILPPYFHAHDWLTDQAPQRPYIWPYSLPLYTQKDVVICHDKVDLGGVGLFPKDFSGLSFVMWRGDGRAGQEFDQMVKRKEISVHLVNSIEVVINLLVTARYDCTVSAALPFRWYLVQQLEAEMLNTLHSKRPLKVVSVVSTNQGYLGYSDINAEQNFPYKKDFSIKFDIEIYRMKQSGELENIAKRFVDPSHLQKALEPK